MERLKCKACGCFSMMPLEITVESEEEAAPGGEQESRFYTCHVCGDNWLSVKETDMTGDCKITFVHQMGIEPALKRIAHMQTQVILKEDTVNEWAYFMGEDEVDAEAWQEKLTDRRKVLKSICCN